MEAGSRCEEKIVRDLTLLNDHWKIRSLCGSSVLPRCRHPGVHLLQNENPSAVNSRTGPVVSLARLPDTADHSLPLEVTKESVEAGVLGMLLAGDSVFCFN